MALDLAQSLLYCSALMNIYRPRGQSEARQNSAVAPEPAEAARQQHGYWSLDHAVGKRRNVGAECGCDPLWPLCESDPANVPVGRYGPGSCGLRHGPVDRQMGSMGLGHHGPLGDHGLTKRGKHILSLCHAERVVAVLPALPSIRCHVLRHLSRDNLSAV